VHLKKHGLVSKKLELPGNHLQKVTDQHYEVFENLSVVVLIYSQMNFGLIAHTLLSITRIGYENRKTGM
jgi:hypothetical protein